MRPDMSDSFTSGQPLYLLYSYSYFGAPGAAVPFVLARPTHATGKVRLHVTGKPPTINELAFCSAQLMTPNGSDAAARPCSTLRRETVTPLNRPPTGNGALTRPGVTVAYLALPRL